MVVCKFFLQGNCKYGDFCKFEHQLGERFNTIQNQSNPSILRQPHFGTSQQAKSTNPSNVDTSTLVKSVVNDMTVAEKGGQWLLSCYAPFKEKPGFPGFEDQSFEEVRLGYYEAIKNGTLEQYKEKIQMMFQQAILKLKSLQVPSPDIINILKSIYNTPPSTHSGVFESNSNTFNNSMNTSLLGQQQSSVFGAQPVSSVFAQPLFGNSTQLQNKYGNASNIFGNPTPNTSIFGGQASNTLFSNSQVQNSNKSVFTQAKINFENQSGGSVFREHQPVIQTSTASIFNSGQSNNDSIFGRHQSAMPFTTQSQAPINSSNIFGKRTNSSFEATSVFGTQNNSGPFNQAATHNNIFGAALNPQPFVSSSNMQPSVNNQAQNQSFETGAKNSIFSQQNEVPAYFAQQTRYQNPNSFGQQVKSAADTQNHSSIFGNNQLTGNLNLPLRQNQQVDETLYSKLEDLTKDQVKWFESDELDILNIPEEPPTYEMCFKA